MRVKASTRSRFICYVESITGIGVKVGIPVFIIAAAYLLYLALGPRIHYLTKLSQTERAYFLGSCNIALLAINISAVVVVTSFIIRHFYDEALGQSLTFLGALLYFGSPAFMALFETPGAITGPGLAIFISILDEFRLVGEICLLPGLTMVLRDAILRIWTGISVRRTMERRWGDEEERRRKPLKPKIYCKCWEMAFCRDFVKKVCPAFQVKKNCWRMRLGCYCDEKTILTAMTSFGGADNEFVRGIMSSLGLNEDRRKLMNSRQKRARCRRCVIYGEHQRQKYRIISPAVAPAILLLFMLFWDPISKVLGKVLLQADMFMRFLAYRPAGTATFAQNEHTLVILASISLGVILVSYALRIVEYMIFELQV